MVQLRLRHKAWQSQVFQTSFIDYFSPICHTLTAKCRKGRDWMQTIQSSLPGTRGTYGFFREALEPDGFTLANWDYNAGYLDKKLDEAGMVFLRIPVRVQEGELDSEDAWLELGTPFVLKHVYREGIESDVGYYSAVASAAMNQFQEPVDKDAAVDEHWMRKAEAMVRELERRFA